MSLIDFVNEAKDTDHLQSSDFGLPATRKFPLSSATQVKMATVHFSKAKDANKAELARNIVKKAKEHGVTIHNEEILKWAGVSKEEGKSKNIPTEQHPNLTRLDNLRKTLPQSEHSKLDIIKDVHKFSPNLATKHLDEIEGKKEEVKVIKKEAKTSNFDESKLPKGVTLTGKQIKYKGVTLHQLYYSNGVAGGYIEKPENIGDNAKVYGDAKVYGKAMVYGSAEIKGKAEVYGTAQVYDSAVVKANAKVYGNAEVKEYCEISGNAKVYDNARVLDQASISGFAEVYGSATVGEKAKVYDEAKVYGDSEVYGNAQINDEVEVSDYAKVYGDIEVYGNSKINGDYIIHKKNGKIFKTDNGIHYTDLSEIPKIYIK